VHIQNGLFLFFGLFNKCYTHGVICNLWRWIINRWRAGVCRDSGPVTTWHRYCSIPLVPSLFVYVAFGSRGFSFPWRFPCAVTEMVFRMSSWEVVRVVRQREWDPRRMDPNSERTYGHCQCAVGFNSTVWPLNWLPLSPPPINLY
jgi:hypothetical protein